MPSNSTIPITDSLHAGYYDLTYTADIAQHSFCRSSNVNFQCYGGLSGHDLHFPADLYEPTMFFPDDEGSSEPANLQFARGMAQYTLDPEIKSNYDSTSGGFLGLGDCSGIIYAVDGVCHQMCNRILMADPNGGKNWSHKFINWPPSLYASYWLYDYWGSVTDEYFLLSFADELFNSIATGNSRLTQKDIEMQGLENLYKVLDVEEMPKARRKRLENRFVAFEKQSQAELPGTLRNIISELDLNLMAGFQNACLNLFTGGYSPTTFASTVNGLLHNFFAAIQRDCPEAIASWIQGNNLHAPVSPQDVIVVVPEFMATTEQYQAVGSLLFEMYQDQRLRPASRVPS